MPVAQLRRNLKAAERLDLILRRAVPDRVRSPQDIVRSAELEELPESVSRRIRIAHEVAPSGAQLCIHVSPGLHAVLCEAGAKCVDTVGSFRVVRAFRFIRNEARV